MTAPQSLLQAAVQRLGARLGSGLVDVAANLALLAQDAPERIRQEWQLFCEEVEAEAERIERGTTDTAAGSASVDHYDGVPAAAVDPASPRPQPGTQALFDPQEEIDALRAKVALLARQLDQRS